MPICTFWIQKLVHCGSNSWVYGQFSHQKKSENKTLNKTLLKPSSSSLLKTEIAMIKIMHGTLVILHSVIWRWSAARKLEPTPRLKNNGLAYTLHTSKWTHHFAIHFFLGYHQKNHQKHLNSHHKLSSDAKKNHLTVILL